MIQTANWGLTTTANIDKVTTSLFFEPIEDNDVLSKIEGEICENHAILVDHL